MAEANHPSSQPARFAPAAPATPVHNPQPTSGSPSVRVQRAY